METADKILILTRQLYPTGRAFKMPFDGYMEGLHRALAQSEAQSWDDAVSILKSILPDNDDFSADDATDWERRLGLITNESVSLDDRKLAIKRKINHPGDIKARQNYLYLEGQLQAAGFDVYVYENRFSDGMGGYTTMNPEDLAGSGYQGNQYGDFQYGDQQYGSYWSDVIVNNIELEKDLTFDIGDNLRSTFFIGGSSLGDFADVDENRRDEFRQLILRIKPVQTVGFLFINYV